MIELKQGDSLELLKEVENKSIDLVLTDPPYNIKKAKWDKWKTKEAYQELISIFGIDSWEGFREYESLRIEYESLRIEYESLRIEYESLRYVHNLDNEHNNVWTSSETNNGENHPMQKPLDIIERIIKTSTNEGHTILDPFMGSGTTGVACKKLDRGFIGMELDEKYFEIAEKRINQT